MKVLVIQQKMIGDVLTSSMLFEALKTKYPDAQLDYLINSHTFPVVENNPFIDDIVFFTKEAEQSKRALFKLAQTVRKSNYDVVIDVYSKLSSNIITLFSGAKTKISYDKSYTRFVYHHNVKRHTDKGKGGLAMVNRMQLLEALGIEPEKFPKPRIYLTKEEKDKAKAFLSNHEIDLNQPLFMIGVLGSGKNKTYPFPYMAKVIEHIVAKTQGQILFNYIPNQESDAKAIYNLCTDSTKEHIFFDVFGKSLREFLAITHFCDALIGNEGGATNMAKALNISTFTIFSPWIKKESWNQFDDDASNISVHLKDYHPELYEHIAHPKELKKEAEQLYQKFNPELFENRLKSYLKQF